MICEMSESMKFSQNPFNRTCNKDCDMMEFVNKLKSFPENVKNAIVFLYFSWIWLVISWYYIRSELLEARMLICGIALCVLVPMIKNWARALCVLCNAFVILQLALPTYLFFVKGNYKLGLIWSVNIIFFLITSYYLLSKETAAFFKMNVKKPEEAPSSDKK